MTYFGFLVFFVVTPILALLALLWRDARIGRKLPAQLTAFPAGWLIILLVMIALLYTTPWDNYLVATSVWWYDPDLVTGLTLGWVPIEEYAFFILQTLLTGLWVRWLASRVSLPRGEFRSLPRLRLGLTLTLGFVWLITVGILVLSWQPGTYLALILIWALPPVMLQTAFGADILWHHRSWVLLAVLAPTFYLGFADTLAIRAGTWTISPDQTLGLHLPGGLPLEELIFFLMTNILVTFGISLAIACKSQKRIHPLVWAKIIRFMKSWHKITKPANLPGHASLRPAEHFYNHCSPPGDEPVPR